MWLVDRADGVDGDQRADQRAVLQGSDGRSDARLDRARGPVELGNRGAGASPDAAFFHAVRGCLTGGVACRGVGSHVGAADAEVEQRRGGHDRHRAGRGGKADAAFFEIAHHARRRVQPEGGAAGQQDRVRAADQATGPQEIRFARRRRSTTREIIPATSSTPIMSPKTPNSRLACVFTAERPMNIIIEQ